MPSHDVRWPWMLNTGRLQVILAFSLEEAPCGSASSGSTGFFTGIRLPPQCKEGLPLTYDKVGVCPAERNPNDLSLIPDFHFSLCPPATRTWGSKLFSVPGFGHS